MCKTHLNSTSQHLCVSVFQLIYMSMQCGFHLCAKKNSHDLFDFVVGFSILLIHSLSCAIYLSISLALFLLPFFSIFLSHKRIRCVCTYACVCYASSYKTKGKKNVQFDSEIFACRMFTCAHHSYVARSRLHSIVWELARIIYIKNCKYLQNYNGVRCGEQTLVFR